MVVVTLVQYDRFAARAFEWVSPQTLEAPPLTHLEFSQIGEYYPETPESYLAFRRQLPAWRNASRAGPCRLDAPRHTQEVQSITIHLDCSVAAIVPLPLLYSPYHRVRPAGEGALPLAMHRTAADPRLHVTLTEGQHELVVEPPTLPAVLRVYSGLND